MLNEGIRARTYAQFLGAGIRPFSAVVDAHDKLGLSPLTSDSGLGVDGKPSAAEMEPSERDGARQLRYVQAQIFVCETL